MPLVLVYMIGKGKREVNISLIKRLLFSGPSYLVHNRIIELC